MKEDIVFKYFPELGKVERERISALYGLYADWNSRINVISRKDIEEIYTHHILHSLALYRFMKERDLQAAKILDIGTGGGFPGIPLAIVLPGVQFTLCDSIAKKIKVVSAVSEALGLKNVLPVWGRSETLDDRYDYVVSRAVTELKKFMPLSDGLYEKGILYLKGGDTEQEIRDCVRERKMKSDRFSVVNISDWFEEEFFAEKKIVFIEK